MKRKHTSASTPDNMKSSQHDAISEETVTQPQTKEENSASVVKERFGSKKKHRKERQHQDGGDDDAAGEPNSSNSGNHNNLSNATTNQRNHNNNNNNSSSSGDMRSEATESTANSRASSPCSEGSYSSQEDSSKSSYVQEVSAASLLPSYLSQMVQHSHEDFFVSPYFYPEFIAQLMCEGFLPIATSRYLLPKLHKERCVIHTLQQQNPQKSIIHTPKSTKKKLKRFTFSINQDFDGVVKGCHKQHGVAWLYPPIVAAFKCIHELTKPDKHDTNLDEEKNNDGSSAARAQGGENNQNQQQGRGVVATLIPSESSEEVDESEFGTCEVKLYSVEVWNQETGELAGGELGYTIGSIYTSLTGFSSEDSAGSVQLAALGKILTLSGYEMWDLGMTLDYKKSLGAQSMDRLDFINCVKTMRVKSPSDCRSDGCHLRCDTKMNCKEIFNMDTWNGR